MTQENAQLKKFRYILLGFFIVFFLTIGTTLAITIFKGSLRKSQNLNIKEDPSANVKDSNDCVVEGCSGQFCISHDEAEGFVSTCEYSEKYACYKTAVCETQSDGACGWTQTTELTTCLNSTR